jgi:hypothetical protein
MYVNLKIKDGLTSQMSGGADTPRSFHSRRRSLQGVALHGSVHAAAAAVHNLVVVGANIKLK